MHFQIEYDFIVNKIICLITLFLTFSVSYLRTLTSTKRFDWESRLQSRCRGSGEGVARLIFARRVRVRARIGPADDLVCTNMFSLLCGEYIKASGFEVRNSP